MEEAALCQCAVFGSRSWYEYLTMSGSGFLDWADSGQPRFPLALRHS